MRLQKTSQAGTVVDLARASLKMLRIICLDSSDAILALAVAFAARGMISSVGTRITAIVALEVSGVMANKKQPRVSFPNTLVLLCMLIPHLLGKVSSLSDLCSATQEISMKPGVNLGSKNIVLLVEKLAVDFKLASCMRTITHYGAMGFVPLLDTALWALLQNPTLFAQSVAHSSRRMTDEYVHDVSLLL